MEGNSAAGGGGRARRDHGDGRPRPRCRGATGAAGFSRGGVEQACARGARGRDVRRRWRARPLSRPYRHPRLPPAADPGDAGHSGDAALSEARYG